MPRSPVSGHPQPSALSASRVWAATSLRIRRAILRKRPILARKRGMPTALRATSGPSRRSLTGPQRRTPPSHSAASSCASRVRRRATAHWARRSPRCSRRPRRKRSSARAPKRPKRWRRAVWAPGWPSRVDISGGDSHCPAMKALSDRPRAIPARPFLKDDRNPGIPLDLDVVAGLRVNRSAVERRAATIPTRRTVKREWQAAWLLRAITCMDLTTLQGDDTPTNVLRLCAKAKSPVRPDLIEALGVGDLGITVGAVCVYHAFVPLAVEALQGSAIPVAAVSTGFPAGLNPLPQRIDEIRASVAAGAGEIDVVITRAHALAGAWEALYDEVRAFRAACGTAHMKVILGTGDLATLANVARASQVAMMAGADFIKTSTGKEAVNATLPVGVVMT